MARNAPAYVCQSCGAVHARWAGRCSACGAWNALPRRENNGGRWSSACGAWNALSEEHGAGPLPGTSRASVKGRAVRLESLDAGIDEAPRMASSMNELDRVTGGGLVPGSALLVGGEPGIGKSTLLLQVAAKLAETGRRALYFSGEEASAQVRLRAERLGLAKAPVALAAETQLGNIIATLEKGKAPDLVIIDSVQTLWAGGLEAAPGTVSQLRTCTRALISHVKATGSALLLVGHVTKDGQIAGPKVIEHMVDTVLYFEGDRGHPFRILRAVKNRFGPTDEIGVFEMRGDGLSEVANPSELFLGDREHPSPGAAVFAGMEGTRPILVEIQALVAVSSLGTPRRAVVGWESNRLSMLLAVLEARCGVDLAGHDVYLNVAGGLRITEPAADLAAAAALVSSLSNMALPADAVFFGEISLSGAVRSTSHMTLRLKEARKLGFKVATIPAAGELNAPPRDLDLERIAHLKGFVNVMLGRE